MEQVKAAFAAQQTSGVQPQQLREANQWLEHFQGTPEAWQVSDQLLSLPMQPTDQALAASHVFAAQTMRTKIQYDWAELPKESHDSLRSSLLSHVLRFGQGPAPVLTQLCLGVATLALHMESWQTVIPDLVQALTTPAEQAAAKLPCLLELLTVLPEEAENFKVGVMPKQREAFRHGLQQSGPQVMQLLVQVHQQCHAQHAVMARVLRCIASWLRYGLLPSDQLQSSPLLPYAFGAMSAAELFDPATDMLVELIHFTHDYTKHGPLIAVIVPQVLQLQAQYDAARWQREDEDEARALCRLFTETGEQYLQLLLTQQPEWALGIAGAVLRGAAHPEPEIAEITFNFWYILSEEIAGGGRSLTEVQRADCQRRFADIYLSLLEALRGLAEFPTDSDGWHADQKDDFKRFRYAVGDAISDACKVLTSKRCLEAASGALSQRLPAFAAGQGADWRGVESCVFCMRQMITSNDEGFFTAEVVSSMMRLLPTLPRVGELSVTCIRTVGTYANWLNRNPDMLTDALTFVSQGLTNDVTAAAASQSMKHLCEACAEHLAEEDTMRKLLQMYHGTLALPLHCADRVDLISALSFVVSNLALPQILPAMMAISEPLLTRMQSVLEQGSGATEVANMLEQLCALLRSVSPTAAVGTDIPGMQDAPHPSIQMLGQLWELLGTVFAKHGGDSRVMEKLCRCYKHTARNTGQGFKALVPRLLPQVTSWFEGQPHSCFIYMCNVCITTFGDAAELGPVLAESFCRLSATTFRLLSSATGIPDNPDVVDDYFELCTKVLRRQPSLLLEPRPGADPSSALLLTVFQCGCAGLHIQHREAGRAVVNFFDCLMGLISAPAERARLSPASVASLGGVLEAHGSHLVTAIIRSVAGAVPAARVRFLVPVLKALASANAATCRAWIEAAVQALPAEIQIDGMTLLHSLFLPEVLQDAKAFHHAIEAFSSACRRKRAL